MTVAMLLRHILLLASSGFKRSSGALGTPVTNVIRLVKYAEVWLFNMLVRARPCLGVERERVMPTGDFAGRSSAVVASIGLLGARPLKREDLAARGSPDHGSASACVGHRRDRCRDACAGQGPGYWQEATSQGRRRR